MEETLFRRVEQYKDRWSSYGSGTGILNISDKLSANELKRYELFQDYDERFLEQISPDVSVARWEKESVLFEEGSFVDIAFFVVQGEVAVYLAKLQGGEPSSSRPIFDEFHTVALTKGSLSPAGLEPAQAASTHYRRSQAQETAGELAFLSTMDFDLPGATVYRLGEGEIFGEIGALNGWPQSVTAKTLSDCVLVQIRVPALRLMKLKSEAFKQRVDATYRKRSLFPQLKASPLFGGCTDSFIAELVESVDLVSCRPDQVVTEEEAPVDAFYLVRSGFLKVSQRVGEGRAAVSYLSKAMTVGEVELLVQGIDQWKFTVSSVGYSELVKISRKEFLRVIQAYPEIEQELWRSAVGRIKEAGASKRNPGQSEFIEFSLNKGLVEGNSILVIDLNVCTRCDDCVRACADTHGGRPRFVREGDRYDNLLITKACYHCQDPVCLIGCPTGAIRRANVGDVVEIKDNICIGCGTCVNNCPYDAIVLHDTGKLWPDNALPKTLRGTERMLASKCDLCYTSKTGPACVRNCPHHCAFRIGSVEEFQQLLRRDEA